MDALKKFKQHFGDVVPLREIPASVSTNELLDAINKSIKTNRNSLPGIFGYGKIDKDKRKKV